MMKKNILLILGVTSLLFACTKKREYDELFKDGIIKKPKFDDVFLYLPTQSNVSRKMGEAFPFLLGKEKLVKLRYTKTDIEVVEIDSQLPESENESNERLVMSIPILHKAYKCSENRDKECTNKEEEDDELHWSKRPYIDPSLSDIKIYEASLSPIGIDKLVSGCYQEISSRKIDGEITEDGLNVELEKTYSTSGKCLEDIDQAVFSIRHHYSIQKLSTLVSDNYEPVAYPDKDQDVFGFFKNEKVDLTADFQKELSTQTFLLNRWNPKRKTITLNMDPLFKKPKYRSVKSASEEAVRAVNRGLKKAGVDLKIVLTDGSGKKTGDLKNTSLVLVEDPMEFGVFGYGPTVSNPMTGEILQGRVVMYIGEITSFVRFLYNDNLRKKKNSNSNGDPISEETIAEALDTSGLLQLGVTSEDIKGIDFSFLDKIKSKKSILQKDKGKHLGPSRGEWNLEEIVKSITDQGKLQFEDPFGKDYLEFLSKNNIYPAEMYDFNASLLPAIEALQSEESIEPWNELNPSKRQEIIDSLVPLVFTPILIHELGHLLGLRHNFVGSRDKDNFYTSEELKKMGHDHGMPSSSVMEYGAKWLDSLRELGKYDIAALNFGYNRQVETNDGKFLKIKSTINEESEENSDLKIKSYMYCSDEGVTLSPFCNRGDEGQSLTEIVRHWISRYQDLYSYRNFRNNRVDFSYQGDLVYAAARQANFREMRVVFELYDNIKNGNNPPSEKMWQENPVLKDLNQAVLEMGAFLASIVIESDILCDIEGPIGPQGAMARQLIPMSKIADSYTSCSEIPLTDKFTLHGQAGRNFNHIRSFKNTDPLENQIDNRGIWIDKLLALRTLFRRTVGYNNYDEISGNFTSHPQLSALLKFIAQPLFYDHQLRQVEVIDAKTNKSRLAVYPVSYHDTHQILPKTHRVLKEFFGLRKSGKSSFIRAAINTIKDVYIDSKHLQDNFVFEDMFNVFKIGFTESVNEDIKTVTLGTRTYGTNGSGIALELFELFEVARGNTPLNEISDEWKINILIQKIGLKGPDGKPVAPLKVEELTDPTKAKELLDKVKAASEFTLKAILASITYDFKVDPSVMQKREYMPLLMAASGLKEPIYYAEMIEILAELNEKQD